jgi:hypothetical protein
MIPRSINVLTGMAMLLGFAACSYVAGTISAGIETAAKPTAVARPTAAPPAAPGPNPSPSPRTSPTATIQSPTFVLLRATELTSDARVNFMAQGFLPSEQASVTVEDVRGGVEAELEPVTVAQDGQIYEVSATVPQGLAQGAHTLRVSGLTSGRSARATFQVRWLKPTVTLDTYSAKAKHSFGFSGGGFAPGETVDLYLGGLGGSPLATFNADEGGNVIGASAPIPLVEPGDYPLYFVGRDSRTPVSFTFNIQGFQPWVVLDNYSPHPYYLMGFSGSDFVPHETVLVYLNGRASQPVIRVGADENGQFAVKNAFEVPELHGETSVVFVGQQGKVEVSARFRPMAFGPSLELTSYAGRVGSRIAFTGSGWARNETLQIIAGDPSTGRQQVGTFRADASGAFQNAGEFRLPIRIAAGGVPLTIQGEVSHAAVTLWFQVLELQASAELTAYRGPPGTVVSFTGRSFAGGERVTVHVHARGGPVVAQTVADDQGTFERVSSYPVSGEWGDAIPFVMVGEESGAIATTHFKIATPTADPFN